MAEPVGRHRLADTKEGRLTIIVVVGGTLLVALSFLDVWLANTADDGLGARVARVERPDRDEVVVVVETGMAWHPRCVEAELRGGGTVVTHRHARPC